MDMHIHYKPKIWIWAINVGEGIGQGGRSNGHFLHPNNILPSSLCLCIFRGEKNGPHYAETEAHPHVVLVVLDPLEHLVASTIAFQQHVQQKICALKSCCFSPLVNELLTDLKETCATKQNDGRPKGKEVSSKDNALRIPQGKIAGVLF